MPLSLQDVFVNNLKFYRKQCGLSQESLSERLEKGTNYINKIESRASFPSVQVIEQISRVLGIKPWQLFHEDASPANIITVNRQQFVQEVTETLYRRLSDDMIRVLEKL